MKIIRKETLEFDEKEMKAIQTVIEISTELMREATDPELEKLAEKIFDCMAILWGWNE